jgi:hypothetical protein
MGIGSGTVIVDPLAILHASHKNRMKRLLPVRYGRMLQSPFTIYRGSAAVMAADLAKTPSTGTGSSPAARLIGKHRLDDVPLTIAQFVAHDSRLLFGALHHV